MPVVTSHGVDIYYETWGTAKETLVFAHGMGGNAASWFNQIGHFIQDYRIITFDHRYFGRSRCSEEAFRPDLFPDDIMAVMDQEGVDAATFICQSMGGWTGSQMAVHHPERVKALIMSHTPGVFEHQRAVNNRDVSSIVNRPPSALGSPAVADDFPHKNPAGAVLYAQISSFNHIDPAVIPRSIGKVQLGVNTDELGDYAVPTLFITADKDVLFPAEFIETLAATVPGAKCVNLGDAGHSSYFELPQAFNQALAGFLTDTLVSP